MVLAAALTSIWQLHGISTPGDAGEGRACHLLLHTDDGLCTKHAWHCSCLGWVCLQPLQLLQSSPTGTLSTLPSATTASMIESPVGGLARDGSIFREASNKVCALRASASQQPCNLATLMPSSRQSSSWDLRPC